MNGTCPEEAPIPQTQPGGMGGGNNQTYTEVTILIVVDGKINFREDYFGLSSLLVNLTANPEWWVRYKLILGERPKRAPSNNGNATNHQQIGVPAHWSLVYQPSEDDIQPAEVRFSGLPSDARPGSNVKSGNEGKGPKNRTLDYHADFHFTEKILADVDEIWLFGYNQEFPVDGGNSALSQDELDLVFDFMNRGGGVFACGDHGRHGRTLCSQIPRVRHMQKWEDENPSSGMDPRNDQIYVNNTLQPGQDNPRSRGRNEGRTIEFDDQSDDVPAPIRPTYYHGYYAVSGSWSQAGEDTWFEDQAGLPHPLLSEAVSEASPLGRIDILPDHMHEGEATVPVPVERAEIQAITGSPGFGPADGIKQTQFVQSLFGGNLEDLLGVQIVTTVDRESSWLSTTKSGLTAAGQTPSAEKVNILEYPNMPRISKPPDAVKSDFPNMILPEIAAWSWSTNDFDRYPRGRYNAFRREFGAVSAYNGHLVVVWPKKNTDQGVRSSASTTRRFTPITDDPPEKDEAPLRPNTGTKLGRVVTGSSFHHWTDSNLTGLKRVGRDGQPRFPRDRRKLKGFRTEAGYPVLNRILTYHRNVALWLAPPEKQAEMAKRALWGALELEQLAETINLNMYYSEIGKLAVLHLREVVGETHVRQWWFSILQGIPKLAKDYRILIAFLLGRGPRAIGSLTKRLDEFITGAILLKFMGMKESTYTDPNEIPEPAELDAALILAINDGILGFFGYLSDKGIEIEALIPHL